jgi:hypothetical protein
MSQRAILSSVWLVSLGLLLSVVIVLHLAGRLGDQNLMDMVTQLSTTFTPYLSVVLGFYFSDRRRQASRKTLPLTSFAIALAVSLFWNLLLVLYVGRHVFGICCVEDTVVTIRNTGAILAWLVGPPIGFYFGSRS